MSDEAITPKPRARSATEMDFAASLLPCPHCQTTDQPRFDLYGGGTNWGMRGPCSVCKKIRLHMWPTEGNPLEAAVPLKQLGDNRPSDIITVGQFLSEFDRLQPLMREPDGLSVADWYSGLRATNRAITCLYALQKFIPANAEAIPKSSLAAEDGDIPPARLQRSWLQGELDRANGMIMRYAKDMPRIAALDKAALPPPPVGSIDRASLTAHDEWVRGGCQGPGRLDVKHFDASGLRLAGVVMQSARLERVRFDGALLESARMMDCELREVSVVAAGCQSIHLERSTIVGGTFARSGLVFSLFMDTTIDKTSFDQANFDRSEWRGARVTDASFEGVLFGNTWFDGAHFKGCSFHGADMRLITKGIRATTSGAVFEDCDLRDTRWDGRDLSGATFIRCKLHGITGKPSATASVKVEAPDLSPDGEGSRIGTLDDVIGLWKRKN